MKLLQKLYYFLIYTNLLIALAAGSQAIVTYLVLNQDINWFVVVIEASATLALYNFSLLLSKPSHPEKSAYARTRWIFRHEILLKINTLAAILLCIYCLFHIHLNTIVFLGIIGLVSVLYSLPIFFRAGKWGGLRQVPILKLFHIALVWVLSSVFLPYIELTSVEIWVDKNILWYLAGLKFFFLIICTLPFDIRDIKQDSYYHLRTLPILIGESRSKKLCYTLLFMHSLFILFAPYLLIIKCGLLLTNLFIFILLRFVVFRSNQHYHYAYLLDLSLVLQFIFVFIFDLING